MRLILLMLSIACFLLSSQTFAYHPKRLPSKTTTPCNPGYVFNSAKGQCLPAVQQGGTITITDHPPSKNMPAVPALK